MYEKFAKTPEPPYYAVLFTAQRSDDDRGYGAMAEKIHAMALASPGCLGAESAYDGDGFGFTLSYWKDEESISNWKQNADHLGAQQLGKRRWYAHYEIRVARVERAYSGPEGR